MSSPRFLQNQTGHPILRKARSGHWVFLQAWGRYPQWHLQKIWPDIGVRLFLQVWNSRWESSRMVLTKALRSNFWPEGSLISRMTTWGIAGPFVPFDGNAVSSTWALEIRPSISMESPACTFTSTGSMVKKSCRCPCRSETYIIPSAGRSLVQPFVQFFLF